jgi:signal-transduction protein with cAMP-binding, CBS, and nucleotidyltransferase domain
MFARIYAVFYKITTTSTPGRIQALFESQVIPQSTYQELLSGYNFLMLLRYKHQVSQYENQEEINNLLYLNGMPAAEETTLRKTLSQVADMQSRLNIDFKRSVL